MLLNHPKSRELDGGRVGATATADAANDDDQVLVDMQSVPIIDEPAPQLPSAVIDRFAVPPSAPTFSERLVVIAAFFVFYHQTPNAWFIRVEDLTLEFSNGLAVLATVGLVAVSFMRVAGYVDSLVRLFALEPYVFLFTGLALLSTVWSAAPSETIRRGGMLVAVALFAIYLVLRFALDQVVAMLAVMFSVSAVINTVFVVAYPYYAIDDELRWTGVFSQKNALGYVAALAIPTLFIAARIRPNLRVFFYGALVLEVLLLIRSDSKTMLLVAIIPMLLMLVFRAVRARRTLPGAVVVSLVSSSLFALAFATANLGLFTEVLDKDVTLTGRVPMWEGLLGIIAERPIVGFGYSAAFGGFFSPVHDIWIYNQWAGDAHNAYIQILLELGAVGLGLFVISYVRAVKGAIKILAIVPGTLGMWPLVILTQAVLLSVTESGIQSDSMGWAIYLVAVLMVVAHLAHRRQLGLSNEVASGVEANRQRVAVR